MSHTRNEHSKVDISEKRTQHQEHVESKKRTEKAVKIFYRKAREALEW